MKKLLVLVLFLLGCPAVALAQGTISLGGAASSKAGEEFATRTFQDPWDMNQRTDVGWWLFGTDQPEPSLTNVTFTNGIFAARSTTTDPSFFVVETGYGGTAAIGKIGTNFPVNADLYRQFSIRMRVTNQSFFQFFWSTNTIHDPPSLQGSNPVTTTAGWRIYTVNLQTLGLITADCNGTPCFTEPWSGTKRSLRFDPTARNNEDLEIDWIRLSQVEPALNRTISWTNNGSYDIYLDTQTRPNNSDATQTLGLLASGVTGTSHAFNLGALPPGTYYVAMRPTNSSGVLVYSTTAYTINAPALITVTSPSPEGSSDDFATTQLNNPWDMNAMTDVDRLHNVSNPQITTGVPVVDLNDNSLGAPSMFFGVSTPANPQTPTIGDPIVYFLAPEVRGFNYRIDPDRYRILTVEMGIPNMARSYFFGSHARIIWHVAGEGPTAENVSLPEVINHRAGVNNIFSFTVDMKTLPLEAGGLSPSHTGWNGGSSSRPGIDGFRVDPHEFPTPTAFYYKRVKLAALETAHTTYTVRWTTTKTTGTITVYLDTDRDPSSGLTPVGSVGAGALTGSLSIGTSGLADNSEWFVYVEHADGTNTNGTYAAWPIKIDHSPSSSTRLSLNRSTLNFGIVRRANQAEALQATSPQVVRVSVVGATGTPPCWTVDNGLPATYTITIEGGGTSKCGSGSFTVALNASNPFNVNGVGEATFTVREVTAGTLSNSPQYVHAWQRIWISTGPPVGTVDTPAEGAVVSGSIGVTGWAVDDVDIVSVAVYRDPVPDVETGLVFIGNAVRVDDARPDIEAAFPDTPFNYRGGWGYLLLTNFLPNGGDGLYRLHVIATDAEGKQTLLGSRFINGANSSTQRPFGAIDTPAQGEVVSAATSYNNFGWVLVRGPAKASPFYPGASVSVVIDGVVVGSPTGWTARDDLTGLFPQAIFPGIPRALGVYTFDPGTLTNGVHTIAWVVTADNQQADGIGSRYFSVAGSSLNALTEGQSAANRLDSGPDLGRRASAVGTIAAVGPQTVIARPMSRVVVDPFRGGAGRYEAYSVAHGELRPLPVGASFDRSRGVLYWQPGVGYRGAYDFVVVRDGRERVPVRVVLETPRERPAAARGLTFRFAAE